MNNKLVINFVPGPTPVHKLAGSTKVLMFLLFTAAIIATFDIRVIAALMIVPIIAIISMRPNYKPLIVLLSVMLVTTGVIGSIMLLIVSPDTGFSHVGGSTIIWQASEKLFITRETLWYLLVTMTKCVLPYGYDVRAGNYAFRICVRPCVSAYALQGLHHCFACVPHHTGHCIKVYRHTQLNADARR